eukprot:Tamp_35002.p1 GENE.Tamp_35002~~Tamp_35002.p1  ORF type:complete len:168 (+),score=12.39 Tamp_35002:37-540(+)
MQGKGGFDVYQGPCGASTVYAWLLEIQGRSLQAHDSANPASYSDLDKLEARILQALPPAPTWLVQMPAASTRLVCFGGASSAFRATAHATGKNAFSAQDVDQAIGRLCTSSDDDFERLGYVQPKQVLAKLTLVRTVLRHLLPPSIHASFSSANGSTQGMLLFPDLWK